MYVALLLSGGKGSRMGLDVPKQYVTVKGRPVFLYSLKTLPVKVSMRFRSWRRNPGEDGSQNGWRKRGCARAWEKGTVFRMVRKGKSGVSSGGFPCPEKTVSSPF